MSVQEDEPTTPWMLHRDETQLTMLPWEAVDPIEQTLLKRHVGVLSMVFLAFFWVSGGIYGNEALLSTAPGLYVIGMLVGMPLLFSMPIALISAELASTFPVDGGQCVYVQRACGEGIGGHNCYWVWLTNVIDASIYPILASQYIARHVDLNFFEERLICMTTIGVITLVNLLGVEVLTRFQGALFVLTLSPCAILVICGLPHLSFEAIASTRDDAPVDWSLLLSWGIWLYSGFSSLGTIAGETDEPRRTYLQTIAILFPLIILLNTLPISVALSVDQDTTDYGPGYFSDIGAQVGGPLLKMALVVGSNIALIGLYNSQAITAQCTLFFFVESRETIKRMRLAVLHKAVRGGNGARAAVVEWLLDVPASGVPRVYVLFTAAVACGLVWLPYTALVEFEVLFYSVSQLLFLFAYVYLRVAHKDVERPFEAARTLPGAFALVVLPAAICIINLYLSFYVDVSAAAAALVPPPASPPAPPDAGGHRAHQVPVEPFIPGPNFQTQAFISVVLVGAFVHAIMSVFYAPDHDLDAPDEPLEQPLAISARQVVREMESQTGEEETASRALSRQASSRQMSRRESAEINGIAPVALFEGEEGAREREAAAGLGYEAPRPNTVAEGAAEAGPAAGAD